MTGKGYRRVLFLGGPAHGERYSVFDDAAIYRLPSEHPLADERGVTTYEIRTVTLDGRDLRIAVPQDTSPAEAKAMLGRYLADVVEGREVPA